MSWEGGAPNDERYQCHATRRCGIRCRKWALKGSKYCQFHGGRRSRDIPVRTAELPVFYSHRLTKTLNEMVEDHLSLDPNEQLSLLQELALMRQAASEAVALYSAATKSDSSETRNAAAMIMVDALKNVQTMCQAATSVEATRKDRLDGFALKTVIAQVARIAYDCFGDTEDARRFEDMLRETIKVPGEVEAAKVSPDEQVRMMMEVTIGNAPSQDDNESE